MLTGSTSSGSPREASSFFFFMKLQIEPSSGGAVLISGPITSSHVVSPIITVLKKSCFVQENTASLD